MFNKKSLHRAFRKTNRIVEGTIIKGDIVSQADFRLDGELIGNFFSTGKLVIGPAGIITDIQCKKCRYRR
jgi:cytoskeletal protein CcmA (bactofilin family)